MRVIFERTLDGTYVAGRAFTERDKVEPIDEGLNRQARSKVIADIALDSLKDGIEGIYIVCGSAHAEEIFTSLSKRAPEKVTFIAKMSSTD